MSKPVLGAPDLGGIWAFAAGSIGAPQFGQNVAPSEILAPHLGQKDILSHREPFVEFSLKV